MYGGFYSLMASQILSVALKIRVLPLSPQLADKITF
jgi:hypothetical protein